MRKLTLEEIIKKSEIIQGKDRYDFLDIFIINKRTYIKLRCKKCGHEFDQNLSHHMKNQGCQECKKKTFENAIEESIEIYGINRFEYLDFYYDKNDYWIKVKCLVCDTIIETRLKIHLNHPCKVCYHKRMRIDKDEIKERINIIHGGKLSFLYMKDEYINERSKFSVSCNDCGLEYETSVASIIHSKSSCQRCSGKQRLTLNEVRLRSLKVHKKDRYEYLKIYRDKYTDLEIKCNVCNNIFVQNSDHHLRGRGCSICNESSGEKNIELYLLKNDIEFIRQKKFDDCLYKKKLSFDFYLPTKNVCIEFDGIQHFESVKRFGGDKSLDLIKIKDKIKNVYCLDNNIKLVRIRYDENIDEKINENI